jgi:hypothetical protein
MGDKSQTTDTSYRRVFKRIAIGILLFIGLGFGAFLLYVQIKKNDISRELLQRVNQEFNGEFTVGAVSVGDLFSYPDLEINLKDLRFWESKENSGNRRKLIIEAPDVRLNADLSDLLKEHILINELVLKNPTLIIEQDSSGRQIISKAFSPVHKNTAQDSSKLLIEVQSIIMTQARVIIEDRPSDLHLPVLIDELHGDFHYEEDKIDGKVNISISPRESLDTLGIETEDIKMHMRGAYGLNLKSRKLKFISRMTELEDQKFSLDLNLDYLQEANLTIDVSSSKEGLKLEELFQPEADSGDQNSQSELMGIVHFNSKLSWRPRSKMPFYKTVDLLFSLEGEKLELKGADLDKFIEKFKRSQNFNLADVGAVMFAGPAGLAMTKGGDYASLALGKKGETTEVGKFLAEWRLSEGKLETQDVALSTKKNRLSVDGRFDVLTDSLTFNFHVIDKKGCELVGQKVYGTAEDLKFGKVNLVKTFLGPVKNFFRDVGIGKCKIVYEGRVSHPNLKRKKNE